MPAPSHHGALVKSLLFTAGIHVAAAAAGLILSALWLPGFRVQWQGFVAAAVILAGSQALLAPIVAKMASRFAPTFISGAGIIVALVALLIASILPGGVTVAGFGNWLLCGLILWILTATGSIIDLQLRVRRRRAKELRA